MDPSQTLELVGIISCLVLSALFSGSETALTSLSEVRIRRLLDESTSGSRILKMWLKKPNHLLSTILVGNNLANISASSLATDLSYSFLSDAGMGGSQGMALAVAIGATTLAFLVFGEVIPKTFAKHNRTKWIKLFPILSMFERIFWPFSAALSRVSTWFVSLFGGETERTQPLVTEEELEFMVKQSAVEGSLDAEQEQMLTSVFDFHDTMVKEIMVPRTETVAFDKHVTLEAVYEEIKRSGYSRYPVYEESLDKVLGMFYIKDLLNSGQLCTVEGFGIEEFLHPPFYVPETKSISSLLKEFQKEKTHIAIAVDEFGGTAGIVTLEDIIEEIVGEIYDEYDAEDLEEHEFREISPGRYLVHARINLDDLAELLDTEFPEPREYDTLAGFVMTLTGQVPDAGVELFWGGFGLIIKEATDTRIDQVEVYRLGEQAATDLV